MENDSTGGSKAGEPFDVEEVMNISDKLQSLQFARKSMGDEAVKAMLGQDPALLETNLREKRAEGRKMLLKLAMS